MATDRQFENSLQHGDEYYATLDFISPSTIGTWGQKGFFPVPHGWVLAMNSPSIVEHVISAHPWGCSVLMVEDGTGYGTALHDAPGKKAIENNITFGGNDSDGCIKCKPAKTPRYHYRILISTPAAQTITPAAFACVHNSLFAGRWLTSGYQIVSLGAQLWSQHSFSDLEIECGGRTFQCHRAILSAASPVFKRILESEMQEAREKRISIDDAIPEAVESLLEYMYMGVCKTSEHAHCMSVMALADKYEVAELFLKSANVLVNGYTNKGNIVETAKSMIPFATRPQFQDIWAALCDKILDDQGCLEAVVFGLSSQTSPLSLQEAEGGE